MKAGQSFLDASYVRDALISASIEICKAGSFIEKGDTSICDSMVNIMAPPVLDSISQNLITKNRICNEWLHRCNRPTITQVDLDQWVSNLLSTKPASIQNDNFVNNMYSQIEQQPSDDTITLVHISDPHLDFQYVEGSLADCGSYLCCRPESGPIPTDSTKAAGKWGSYKCDLP